MIHFTFKKIYVSGINFELAVTNSNYFAHFDMYHVKVASFIYFDESRELYFRKKL